MIELLEDYEFLEPEALIVPMAMEIAAERNMTPMNQMTITEDYCVSDALERLIEKMIMGTASRSLESKIECGNRMLVFLNDAGDRKLLGQNCYICELSGWIRSKQKVDALISQTQTDLECPEEQSKS